MKGDIIPDGEFLYKYAKPETFPEGQTEVPFGIFIDESLSCDWAAYQKRPEHSFHIKEGKSVIIRIAVCDEIRNPCNPERPRQAQPAWAQKIEHDPIEKGQDLTHPDIDNPSHSLINGKKKNHITKAIARNSTIYRRVNLDDHLSADINEKTRASDIEPTFNMGWPVILSVIVIGVILLIITLLS